MIYHTETSQSIYLVTIPCLLGRKEWCTEKIKDDRGLVGYQAHFLYKISDRPAVQLIYYRALCLCNDLVQICGESGGVLYRKYGLYIASQHHHHTFILRCSFVGEDPCIIKCPTVGGDTSVYRHLM